MTDISKLSNIYDVREMHESDADNILEFCRKNVQYYLYCEAEPTKEQILSDLNLTPPGIGPELKHYIGFFQGDILVAVMDLIDGYPEENIAFIGFFMMNADMQGRGIGSALIDEAAAYLKTAGKTSIRLAIDKGNPQSTHFWKKNGFAVISEVDRDGHALLVAERML